MRRSLPHLLYIVALFFLPVVEVAIIAPLMSRPWVIFFPIVVTIAFFALPNKPWWVLSLIGAMWHDVATLAPFGVSVAGMLVLGLVLTILTSELTSRSFGGDVLTVVSGLVLAAAAMIGTTFLDQYLFATVAAWPDVFFELMVVAISAFGIAEWRRYQSHRHQYVTI